MEDLLIQLKNVVTHRSSLLQQEAALWQRVAEALDDYCRNRPKAEAPNAIPSPSKHPNDYLRTKEAAAHINMSTSVLEHWRIEGGGPRFLKIGRSVRYKVSDLDEYLSSRLFKHTSAYQLSNN